MRDIDTIVIHTTATPGNDRGDVSIDEVRKWHTSAPRNWSDVGYHFLIRRDGSVEIGRDLDRQGAHVRGHNAHSIGIVYTGGIDPDTGLASDTRTDEQKETLLVLVSSLLQVFPAISSVKGHRDFDNVRKACPCFDVVSEFGYLLD